MMIDLSDAKVVGTGNERVCYEHPTDAGKVIKVTRDGVQSRKQNTIDMTYYRHLYRKGVDTGNLAKCYGLMDTNIGKGLVFHKIANHDGAEAPTFEEAIRKNIIDPRVQEDLLADLIHYLKKNTILFVDVGLSNLICRKEENNQYKLYIIDGIGSRHMGLKFWMYRTFPFLAKRKMNKQVKKLQMKFESARKERKD